MWVMVKVNKQIEVARWGNWNGWRREVFIFKYEYVLATNYFCQMRLSPCVRLVNLGLWILPPLRNTMRYVFGFEAVISFIFFFNYCWFLVFSVSCGSFRKPISSNPTWFIFLLGTPSPGDGECLYLYRVQCAFFPNCNSSMPKWDWRSSRG